ncbi:MAG: hypothetical protein M3P11_08625 [Actinomycetota bacterium]|nr:hypothetical protein [Actinomycetota bacterium]
MASTEGRSRLQRRTRWPPPPPISPAGTVAAFTTTGSVIASGLLWLFASYRVFSCVHDCAIPPGLGGLLILCLLPIVVLMVWTTVGIAGRPVERDGRSGWMFGLSVIFALGVFFAATRIPSYVCPAGMRLSHFDFCYAASNDRIPPNDWRWLKEVVDLGGAILALTLVRARRWVFATASIAGAMWLFGSLDLLMRRIAHA